MSQHRKPILQPSNLWRSLDKWTWISYIFLILSLTNFIIFFAIFIGVYSVDVTELGMRMGLGWLEPHEITWFNGFKSIKVIVAFWLLLGISFNLFYNVEFRSSLIAQKFPGNIEDFDHVDILANALFIPSAYKGTRGNALKYMFFMPVSRAYHCPDKVKFHRANVLFTSYLIVTLWLLLRISFNLFYNIEF